MKSRILLIMGILVVMSLKLLNAQPHYFSLKQPNGVTFQAKEAGYCCFLKWHETAEGYMVVRGSDRYYQYAIPHTEKGFAASGLRVGIDKPQNVIRNVKDNPAVIQKIQAEADRYNAAVEKNRQRFLKFQGKSGDIGLGKVMATITLNIGVLLVEFNDLSHHTPAYQKSHFEDMLFPEDEYYTDPYEAETPDYEDVFGSLNDYYQVQSSGELTITGHVINPVVSEELVWLEMDYGSSYYAGSYAPTKLVVDAINKAIYLGWNVNFGGDDFVIMVIVAGSDQDLYSTGVGYPQSWSGLEKSKFDSSFDWDHWFGSPVYHERSDGWAGPHSQGVAFTHIGIWCHELGHVIGSGLLGGLMGHPSYNTGDWTVMDVGYRSGPLRKGECPPNFDPPAIISYGWNTPTVINYRMTNESIQYINDKTNQKDFYRFNDFSSNSMFVLENRQYEDFNAYLPEYWESGDHGGMLVWYWSSPTSNSRTIRPADNDYDDPGAPYWSDGDMGDPFPGFSDNRAITMATTPNTNNGSNTTGFAVTNISNSSTNMSADLYKNFWVGTITSNTTWYTANSPYYVGGNITVNSGATLTIQAGVTIEFGGYYSITISSGSKIIAEGTSSNHIEFTKNTSNWGGVIVNSSNNSFKYCDFEYSNNEGLKLYGSPSQASNNIVEYCSFKNCSDYGLSIVNNNSPQILHCRDISYNEGGIFLNNNTSVKIEDTWVISNEEENGIQSSYGDLLLYKCLIKDNNDGYGIYSYHDNELDLSWTYNWGGGNSIHNNYRGIVIYYYQDDYVYMDWYSELPNSDYSNTSYEVEISNSGSACVFAEEVYWKESTNPTWYGNVDHDYPLENDQTGLPKGGSEDFPVFSSKRSTDRNPGHREADIPEEELRSIIEDAPNSESGVKALRKLRNQIRRKAMKSEDSMLEEELVDYLETLYTNQMNTMVGKKALTYLVQGKMRQDKYAESIELCKEGLEVLDSNDLHTIEETIAWLYIHTRQFEKAQAALTDLRTNYGDIPACSDYIDYLDEMLIDNMDNENILKPEEPAAESILSEEFDLSQNYPNPANPSSTIIFKLPESGKVSLRIFNILGQEVKILIDEHREAGSYTFVWDGKNNRGLSVPSGIYLYTLKAGDKVFTKKLMLLR